MVHYLSQRPDKVRSSRHSQVGLIRANRNDLGEIDQLRSAQASIVCRAGGRKVQARDISTTCMSREEVYLLSTLLGDLAPHL